MVGFMFFTSFFFIFFFSFEKHLIRFIVRFILIFMFMVVATKFIITYCNPLRKISVIKYLCPTIQLFILHYFVINFSYNLQVVF